MVQLERSPEGVTTAIEGDGCRYAGAAVLRVRPDPRTREPSLQLGVPDDALGFRPRPGQDFRIRVERVSGDVEEYISDAVWLERVQTSWWFILMPTG